VLLLLLIRHVLTGGTIPFIREARHFIADPASVPKRGQTNAVAPAPGPGAKERTFKAAPEPTSR
jgi:hypothetical protein